MNGSGQTIFFYFFFIIIYRAQQGQCHLAGVEKIVGQDQDILPGDRLDFFDNFLQWNFAAKMYFVLGASDHLIVNAFRSQHETAFGVLDGAF